MRVKDLLKPEAIQIGGSATGKDDAIDKLVALMCKEGNVTDVEGYKAAVRAREAEAPRRLARASRFRTPRPLPSPRPAWLR